jgi:hypothetical protein
MIEANIDDMNPEIYPYVMEKILKCGAKDVFLTNILMKKGRPGTKISVLVDLALEAKIEKILFENTTTIGIRKYRVNRTLLPRSSETIKTKYGELKVKVIEIEGRKIYRPEYEDCKNLAEENNISIIEILNLPGLKNLEG